MSTHISICNAKSNTETISILNTADILVIPKIEDSRSIGYIPSKLGDFLFTGKPVIATSLGEIPKYIINEESGYLIQPDSEISLANCIEKIILNYTTAKKIGKNGRYLTKHFDYLTQSKNILNKIKKYEL
ncbi:glycosyltransferase [Providencia rustigianii]|uniref:glycosyltransferase n=1 Tax=Providencia rustigianii TaxID=158850 RepID=UPI000D837AB1|nr:putative glycosyl transferase [Providencia rustigianii]